MTLPLDNDLVENAADRIVEELRSVKDLVVKVNGEVAVDDYTNLLRLPVRSTQLQTLKSTVQAMPNKTLVLDQVNIKLGATTTLADVVAFIDAVEVLAVAIVNNADLFLMSYSASRRQLLYITPLAAGPKGVLQTSLQGILDTVG